MKAIISERYGSPDTLILSEVPVPTPKENQVLVRVRASSINFGNYVLLSGKPRLARLVFGLMKPKYPIPGGDMAGIVEAVGANVTRFHTGDEVFGDLSSSGFGAFAEYVVVDEKILALKPTNLLFTEAAAVPMAATTALQAIRDKGKLKIGQKVLIQGASGGVGTFAIQITKASGAEVTAVVSTRNVEIAKSIGADKVIDYKKVDIKNHHQTYDLILGVNGSQSITTYKRMLKENGVFIHVGGESSQMYQTMVQRSWLSMTGKKKFSTFLQRANQKDLELMKELIEEGKIKPVIDSVYSLSDVPDAFRYFEQGHSQGKVIIEI
ncbi:NAD(P)-dependent alcohol dehydrogenase [Bacillus sinesaloumensis]|uniref:NAD(P)-dependent alcohol dehydrogenase n=1 Tax=Litchfieldia sinesaloumensis TaxID=1926280 RepID=UPI00098840FE|nr:NAD(P)-dependent alcohol dehydrogenase [Bacillus sinesaloumensis]